MVRVRMKPRTVALALVCGGGALLAVAAGLVFVPAGLAVAGVAMVLVGLFLIPNVEGARESRSARPFRPPH